MTRSCFRRLILGLAGRPPALVGVALATALISLPNTRATEVQRVLGEMVVMRALGKILDISAAADLLAFETPAFHDRVQRARVNTPGRPLQMTTGLVGMVVSMLIMAGVGPALPVIQPLLEAKKVRTFDLAEFFRGHDLARSASARPGTTQLSSRHPGGHGLGPSARQPKQRPSQPKRTGARQRAAGHQTAGC